MPIFVATRLGDLNELGPNLRVYREAWAKAGHPGNGKVYLRVPVYVAATEAQALSEPEESIMHFYRYLGQRIEELVALEGVRAIENRAERGQRLQHINWDEVVRSKVVVGTPAMVADRLRQLQEELGLSGILAEMNCGMRIPHAAGAELAADDVRGRRFRISSTERQEALRGSVAPRCGN